MIIRNNLATAPLRNYSLYFLGCLGLVIVGVFFTIWNITAYSGSLTETANLAERISEQRERRAELKLQASGLQQQIRAIKTPEFVKETGFINNAIKRRIFSWTTLLDQLEKAFSEDVKMVSVSPSIKDERVFLNMEVAGKSLNDLTQLILLMENSPIFSDVSFRSESEGSDGLLHAMISLLYLPDRVAKASQQAGIEPVKELEE
jgi:hypothetical protein